jgi:hypothetical protein
MASGNDILNINVTTTLIMNSRHFVGF